MTVGWATATALGFFLLLAAACGRGAQFEATLIPREGATATPAPLRRATSTPLPTSATTPTSTPTSTATPHPLAALGFTLVWVSERDGDEEIYLVRADGTPLQKLTENEFIFDSYPAPSREGKGIAFTSERDGDLEIYLLEVATGEITRVTDNQADDEMPSWSPDGKDVVFVSDRDGDEEIFVINLESRRERQLTTNTGVDLFPVWSPDGNWISYSFSSSSEEGPDIFVIRPDGSGRRRLTFSPSYDGDLASWTPDSEWLVFPSNRTGNYELYAVRLDGTAFGPITWSEQHGLHGEISPDGKFILVETNDGRGLRVQIASLERMDERISVAEPDRYAFLAFWMPTAEAAGAAPVSVALAFEQTSLCVLEEDPSYGFTPDNPISLGNGPRFGGAFDGFYVDTWLRGPRGERVRFEQKGDLTNTRGEVIALLAYQIEGGRSGNLYVNPSDHTVPRIPTGFSCDLLWP